jgi:hypothetical protein
MSAASFADPVQWPNRRGTVPQLGFRSSAQGFATRLARICEAGAAR